MKKKITILLSAAVASMTAAAGGGLPEPDFVLPIEYTSDPGSNGLSGPEVLKRNETFGNVTRALMKVYLPVSEEPTSCVIIFPGGGYDNVCVGNAGTQGARFFIEHGIAVAVVKYRLPNGHIDVPILDGQQAIKMVRKNTLRLR